MCSLEDVRKRTFFPAVSPGHIDWRVGRAAADSLSQSRVHSRAKGLERQELWGYPDMNRNQSPRNLRCRLPDRVSLRCGTEAFGSFGRWIRRWVGPGSACRIFLRIPFFSAILCAHEVREDAEHFEEEGGLTAGAICVNATQFHSKLQADATESPEPELPEVATFRLALCALLHGASESEDKDEGFGFETFQLQELRDFLLQAEPPSHACFCSPAERSVNVCCWSPGEAESDEKLQDPAGRFGHAGPSTTRHAERFAKDCLAEAEGDAAALSLYELEWIGAASKEAS